MVIFNFSLGSGAAADASDSRACGDRGTASDDGGTATDCRSCAGSRRCAHLRCGGAATGVSPPAERGSTATDSPADDRCADATPDGNSSAADDCDPAEATRNSGTCIPDGFSQTYGQDPRPRSRKRHAPADGLRECVSIARSR